MKKLLKDQKENFHATSKMMRKMREEKNLQKKAEKESKLNRKYEDGEFHDSSKGKMARVIKGGFGEKSTFVYILLISYAKLALSSCGTLNKQVSKDKSTIRSESNIEESWTENSNRNDQLLLESWMQQMQYTSAAIYSDSSIRYQPEQGFTLDKGSLIFTQLTNRQAKLEENIVSNEQANVHSGSKQTDILKSEENSVRSEKERRHSNFMIGVGVIVLFIILFWDWNQKRLKKWV